MLKVQQTQRPTLNLKGNTSSQGLFRGEDPVHNEGGTIAWGMVEKNKTKPGTVLLQVAENIISVEDNHTGAANAEPTFESSSNRNLEQLKTLGALKSYDKTIL